MSEAVEQAPSGGRLVRKSEFAALIGVSRGRVSQYIAEGKLAAPALVAAGARHQLVDVDLAVQQLRGSLDPVQMVAQRTAAVLPAGEDPDIRRWNSARADIAETRVERDRAELLERNGTWVRTAEVRRAWSRELGEMLSLIEADFPAMAERLARCARGDVPGARAALAEAFSGLRTRLEARFAGLRGPGSTS